MQDSWLPPDTDEKKAAQKKFRDEVANLAVVDKLLAVRKELGQRWPAVDEHVGVFGLCFGGKLPASYPTLTARPGPRSWSLSLC